MVANLLKYALTLSLGFIIGLIAGYLLGALIGIFYWYRKTGHAHQELNILSALDFEPEESDDQNP